MPKLKVAHVAIVTPNRCGLYETTRELVVALRGLGVDSRIVDPPAGEKNGLHPGGKADRGAPFAKPAWCKQADILVSHSGLGTLEALEKPQVLVAHGRPRSSFVGEVAGGTPIYTYYMTRNQTSKLKSVVTFWPEHVDHLRLMFTQKPVHYVPACVDLDHWTPGPTGYNFDNKGGKLNIISVDPFRDDIDPFQAVVAFGLWARENPGAVLHMYACNHRQTPGWKTIFDTLQKDGTLGVVQGWTTPLKTIMRAADALITMQTIHTRSIREAAAVGLPIIRIPHGGDISYYRGQFANGLNTPTRAWAEREFNMEATGRAFKKVLDEALKN